MGMLNRAHTRAFILNKWKRLRPGHEINRVSEAKALDVLEARFRDQIVREIRRHPSKGRTFQLV